MIRANLLRLVLVGLFVAVLPQLARAQSAAAQPAGIACESLSGGMVGELRVADAAVVSEGRPAPACHVRGTIESTIGFEAWLPQAAWTGRYLQLGCGGLCGRIETTPQQAFGCAPAERGAFAVATSTYVLWDEHEPERGAVDFSGRNDLAAFVALAGSLGLLVDVRIGPYICGEHFNGGVPIWMRAGESGAGCFRCSDAAWENFTSHVLGAVVGELRRAGALWTQGGPVYLLQVENEYGGGDLSYLRFCVDAARNATTDVPWLLCHDEDLCAKVNAGSGLDGGLALCTINGFWEDLSEEGDQQPSPAFVAAQRRQNPGRMYPTQKPAHRP